MTKSRQKLMSLVVAVMYAMCILVSAPVTAYAATGSHATAAYTKTQKNTATKTALAALAKLPANADAAAKYTTSASLQKLVTAADKALATAKKMKLATTKFKNYGRLTVAKKAVAKLVAAEKAAADAAAALTDKPAAEAVVAKIALIPATVTIADEATVNAAKTAFDALTANGKKLVTNAATLTAAVAKIADLKGTFSVTSVKASSAKTFKVVFTKAVPDTTKIKFEVKKLTTPVTVTATWNDAKTEATLTGATTFAEAVYSVNVKNDATDLGTTTVNITPQKISKIQVTSTKIALDSLGTTGYAVYKVFDQYENDITSSYLAQSITWTSAGSCNGKDGMLTVTSNSGTNFRTFTSVSITGYETTSGVSTTANLSISPTMGTLSDFQFGKTDGIKLVADDLTSVFYVPYTAKDLDGNVVTNYKYIKEGLNFISGSTEELATSSYVTVKLVQDPADSKKAAIELKVKAQTGTSKQVTDLPIVVTVSSKAGTSTQFSSTLYKGAQVATISLMAPNDVIAAGDSDVEIPFEAYDQSGKKMTDYDDVTDDVTFTGLIASEKVDGSLKLKIDPTLIRTKDSTVSLSAVVKNTGKLSQLNLSVQEAAKADALALDTSVLVSAMEAGSYQKIDFGDDCGGLSMKDQYDKDMDMLDLGDNKDYKVAITTASSDLVTVTTNAGVARTYLAGGVDQVRLVAKSGANTEGSCTVTFTLFKDADGSNTYNTGDTLVDTKSTTISIIKPSDIDNFTIEGPKTPIYVSMGTGDVFTAQQDSWDAEFYVYGKTSGGAKTLLAGLPVSGVYVSNSDEFLAYVDDGRYDSAYVLGKKLLDSTKTSATTSVTVNIMHEGKLSSVTTDLTSNTTTPKAVNALLNMDNGLAPLGVTEDEDIITIDTVAVPTAMANAGFVTGNYLVKYNPTTGAKNSFSSTGAGRAAFYFRALDNYGCKGMNFSQISLVKTEKDGVQITSSLPVSISGSKLTVDNAAIAGLIATNTSTVKHNYTFTISAVTNNGLVKTIKVVVK